LGYFFLFNCQRPDIVRGIDEKAFIMLTDIREVFGEGFKTYE